MNNLKNIGIKLSETLSKLPDGLKWIVAVLTGITAIVVSYSQLRVTVIVPLRDRLFPSFPSNRVVFVASDRLTANSYLDLLSQKDFQLKYLHFNQIDELLDYKPGIVIVGGSFSTAPQSLQLSAPVRRSVLRG